MNKHSLLTLLALATQTAQAQPPATRDTFFDSDGVRIRYVVGGKGPPVVFIHGYTGNLDRHAINNGAFAKLADDHTVIAFDARGHGKSGKPHDPKAYGVEMARDVVRLLDHLGIPRAHLVGFSMGAIIAGKVVTTNPDRLLSVTFVGHHPVWRWTEEDSDEAEASARELEGDTPFKSLIVAFTPKDSQLPSDAEIRRRVQPLVAANDVKALAAYQRGRPGLAVRRAELASVRVPTLGIIGTADPSVGWMRQLKTVMPRATTVFLEGAEHGGERGVLRRAEFFEALREHLRSAERR